MSTAVKVAIVYYSQSGQTKQALEAFTRSWTQDLFEIRWIALRPDRDFPFPWRFFDFLRTVPDCVLGLCLPMRASNPGALAQADLVLLGFQPWHLSPSLPAQSFLKSGEAALLKGKNVITFITCRSLWFEAHRRVSLDLERIGAHSAGNIVLRGRSSFFISLLNTFRWIMTGRKTSSLKSLPKAGLSPDQLSEISRHGEKLRGGFRRGACGSKGIDFYGLDRHQIRVEEIARKNYQGWSKMILWSRSRSAILERIALLSFFVNLIVLTVVVRPLAALSSRGDGVTRM